MSTKIYQVLLLFSSLFISVVLAEGVLRLADFSFHLYPERVEFGWPDPQTLDQKFTPDNDVFWVPREPVAYHTLLEEAERRRPDIVFMGCSVTAWSKYPYLLEDLLSAEHPDHDLSVINLAVVGWSSYQGLQQFKRDVVKIKPRLVTIFYGWNDHWTGYGFEDKKVARMHSRYYKHVERFRVFQLLLKSWIVLSGSNENTTPYRVSIKDFQANLEEIVEHARKNNIVPVLITAPTSHVQGQEPVYLGSRWLKDLSQLVPLHRQYIEVVRTVAAAKDVLLCDLAAEFERYPQKVKAEKLFFEDGIHFRDTCDPVVAQFLFDCLVTSGIAETVLGILRIPENTQEFPAHEHFLTIVRKEDTKAPVS